MITLQHFLSLRTVRSAFVWYSLWGLTVVCAKQFMNSPPEDVIFWLAQLFLSTTACMLLTNVDDVARTRVMIAGSIVANVVAIPILAYIFRHNLFSGVFLMLFYGTCGAALCAVVLAIGRRAKRSFL